MKCKTLTCCILLAFFLVILAGSATQAEDFGATTATVSRSETNGFVTPVNQLVKSAGNLVSFSGIRPQALALSPNGKLLAVAGTIRHELFVVDPVGGKVLQKVPLPAGDTKNLASEPVSSAILNPDKEAQLSFNGLVFSPDGSRIYMSNVTGDIKVLAVRPDGKVAPLSSIPLPPATAPTRKEEAPAGLAISAKGDQLYVTLNLSNRLLELDTATGRVLRTWDVGVAPYDVVLAGKKLYVSNWGGRVPDKDSITGPAGRGTLVRVDPVRNIANEGSVSVIDLEKESKPVEILTGMHASGLALSPNGRYLVVANAGSDTLSVIDTRTEQVVETICARQNPSDLFGAQPNALAFDKSGKILYVCNGTQNAVAVFHFAPSQSKLLGLIPVGWFPGAIVHDAARKVIYVANLKDHGPGRAGKSGGAREYFTRNMAGSLSLVPVPSARELAGYTQTALANMRYPLLAAACLPARPGRSPQPVPERVGEPSVFKHVIYIIKENRTYDQVLGDIKEGNGYADFCIFGEKITPNQHKLVREFVLLDNTYCSGILSADGHQWADSAMVTDYLEKSFGGFARSYPCGGEGEKGKDALAYSPAGFIWDNAIAHGKSLINFGEFISVREKRWKDPARKGKPKFLDAYRNFVDGKDDIVFTPEPDIESLRPYMEPSTIGWDMAVPDVWRAAQFIKKLKEFEQRGNLPNLIILYLPTDHTSGTKADFPTPAAQVADNDLAVGRVVEAVSRSSFWKDTCFFVIEDDPQNGWDHVSGYRTTAYVASPYTKRGKVVSTQYNQTSLLRTMELILGLPPMNQMDATATPMFDCFTQTPDFSPFVSVPNNVPLDQMNPEPKKISDSQLRKDAYVSARLPLDKEDQCPEDVFNRIIWRAMKGTQAPYPAWAIKMVDDDD